MSHFAVLCTVMVWTLAEVAAVVDLQAGRSWRLLLSRDPREHFGTGRTTAVDMQTKFVTDLLRGPVLTSYSKR